MWKMWFGLSAALAGLLVACGCGGGGDQAKLRVMNASPNIASVDVLIDGKAVASGIPYGGNSGYLSLDSGSRHLQIETSGTTNILLDQTISLAASSETTYVANNFASSISALVLTDSTTAPASGNAALRIANTAPSLGAADVYVITPGADLVASTPVIRSLAFGAATDYQTMTAGSYEVVLTIPGSTFAMVDTGAISLAAGQNRTIVALNGISGGFTTTLLADLN